MSLVDTIRKDMFQASKEGNSTKADILKLALAEIKNEQIALGKEELEENEVEKILRREVKKIVDSIEQFEKMQREDLVQREKAQLEVINEYLPELLGEDEVRKIVEQKVKEIGAVSVKDMGKIMGVVMKELDGKADGNTVKAIVLELLS
ncbi:MAG: GatB/YqeY domain-containing protein [Candidatus Dojkabacteria bacterium]|jgi:uncharacterized protein YqeY|nr:GatB/YqeY domain-containing protein [Candidatus Dojkabacteria bacterium]MDD4560849.1 GatB/YqeY domain-containing protein [Candidatus Dojkabacteria bacterium]